MTGWTDCRIPAGVPAGGRGESLRAAPGNPGESPAGVDCAAHDAGEVYAL